MKTLIVAAMTALLLGSPAKAWESLAEMNHTINHTNFIVGKGCSGTLISRTDRLVVTAYHCVDNAVRYETKDEVGEDGKLTKVQYEKREPVRVHQKNYANFEEVGSVTYKTNILDYDKERDLALLQVVTEDLRSQAAARLIHKDEPLLRGQDVIAVGNPRMLDASVTTGVISSLNRTFDWGHGDDVPMIQYDAAGAPGSSGGALFTKDGAYIGTTVGGRAGEFVLAIPYFALYDLLAKNCFAELFDPEANDAECAADD